MDLDYPQTPDDIEEWKHESKKIVARYLRAGNQLDDALTLLVDLSMSWVSSSADLGISIEEMIDRADGLVETDPVHYFLTIAGVELEYKRREIRAHIRERREKNGTPRE